MWTELFRNDTFVFFGIIGLFSTVPVIATFWHKTRVHELNTTLKMEMLQRGMTAEEIKMVLETASIPAPRSLCRSQGKQPEFAQTIDYATTS